MEIKTSDYTIYLVIGLIVVTIAKYFFSPLEQTEVWIEADMWNSLKEESSDEIMFFISKATIYLFCPLFVSMFEFFPYIAGIFMQISGEDSVYFAQIVLTCFVCLLYVALLHLLEQFHSSLHEEESLFTICVDMLCLENIVMYIATLLFYLLLTFVPNLNIPELVWEILLIPVLLLGLWSVIFYMSYFFIGLCISIVIPLLIFELFYCLVPAQIGGQLYDAVILLSFLIPLVFFSQVVWRLCSLFIYKKLLYTFSFHFLEMD